MLFHRLSTGSDVFQRIGVVTGIVLRGYMELMGSPVFRLAQHLETVTKIKTVKSVCPGLP